MSVTPPEPGLIDDPELGLPGPTATWHPGEAGLDEPTLINDDRVED